MSLSNKLSFNEILTFVKQIYPTPITNQTPCLLTTILLSQIHQPIFQAERVDDVGLDWGKPCSQMVPSRWFLKGLRIFMLGNQSYICYFVTVNNTGCLVSSYNTPNATPKTVY